jgi:thioesterase domain-containing protein/acyl carrier protein
LGEIEAVLEEYEGVKESVVVVREDEPGDKRLVGYVVSGSGRRGEGQEGEEKTEKPEKVKGREVRRYVEGRLPEYMVPAVVVVLEKLPLTVNGKVDRKALPAPEWGGGGAIESPRDSVELELVRIWQELLGADSIGITDSFFDLGGHSILAVRLFFLIEERFHRKLPLALIFQYSSIEKLAGLLREQGSLSPVSPMVQLQKGGSKTPLFFVHGAGGGAFAFLSLARHLGPEQPFYAFQSVGLEQDGDTQISIQFLASTYIRAMREVQPHGPYLIGGWSMGGTVAFEIALQLEAAGEKVALLAMLDSHVSSDRQSREGDQVMFGGFLRSIGFTHDQLEQLKNVATDMRLPKARQLAQDAQLLPKDADLSMMQRLFDAYRDNVKAVQRYKPSVTRFSIHLMRATAEPEPHASGWRARIFRKLAKKDPTLGWGKYALVHATDVPGDHFTVLREPHVQMLADQLKRCLDSASAKENYD